MSPPKKPGAKVRQSKSKAQLRSLVDDARMYYIHGVIPANKKRTAIRKPSLDDVARELGVPIRTIHARSMAEGWVAERDAHARQVFEAEKTKSVQSLADQHVKARVDLFRSSVLLQETVEKKLKKEYLDMTELSAAGSALLKAQKISDTAVVGPDALLPKVAPATPVQVNTQVNVVAPGSWADLRQRNLSPAGQAFAAALAIQDAEKETE